MSSDVVHVDDSNFETEVLNADKPVLVELGAEWCGPCQRQIPLVEKFANENVGKIKTCKVDIDDCPETVAELGIRSVPTLVIFNAGTCVGTKVGLTTLAELNIFVSSKITT